MYIKSQPLLKKSQPTPTPEKTSTPPENFETLQKKSQPPSPQKNMLRGTPAPPPPPTKKNLNPKKISKDPSPDITFFISFVTSFPSIFKMKSENFLGFKPPNQPPPPP